MKNRNSQPCFFVIIPGSHSFLSHDEVYLNLDLVMCYVNLTTVLYDHGLSVRILGQQPTVLRSINHD